MKYNKTTLFAATVIVTAAWVATPALAHETTPGQGMSASQDAGTAKGNGMKSDNKTMEDGGQCKMIPGKGMGPEPTTKGVNKGMNHGKSKSHSMGGQSMGSSQGMGGGMKSKMMKSMMKKMMQHLGMKTQGMGQGMGNQSAMTPLAKPLDVPAVKAQMDKKLRMRGNPRLKIGAVKALNDKTITAQIVTRDGSLVEKYNIDRATGRWTPVNN